jgi:hypothetical protein
MKRLRALFAERTPECAACQRSYDEREKCEQHALRHFRHPDGIRERAIYGSWSAPASTPLMRGSTLHAAEPEADLMQPCARAIREKRARGGAADLGEVVETARKESLFAIVARKVTSLTLFAPRRTFSKESHRARNNECCARSIVIQGGGHGSAGNIGGTAWRGSADLDAGESRKRPWTTATGLRAVSGPFRSQRVLHGL